MNPEQEIAIARGCLPKQSRKTVSLTLDDRSFYERAESDLKEWIESTEDRKQVLADRILRAIAHGEYNQAQHWVEELCRRVLKREKIESINED